MRIRVFQSLPDCLGFPFLCINKPWEGVNDRYIVSKTKCKMYCVVSLVNTNPHVTTRASYSSHLPHARGGTLKAVDTFGNYSK